MIKLASLNSRTRRRKKGAEKKRKRCPCRWLPAALRSIVPDSRNETDNCRVGALKFTLIEAKKVSEARVQFVCETSFKRLHLGLDSCSCRTLAFLFLVPLPDKTRRMPTTQLPPSIITEQRELPKPCGIVTRHHSRQSCWFHRSHPYI